MIDDGAIDSSSGKETTFSLNKEGSSQSVSAGDRSNNVNLQLTCFTEEAHDVTLHFQIISLSKQIYIWIGCNSAKLGHLYAGAPTRPRINYHSYWNMFNYWVLSCIIAQLRTNSHQLRCETGRWKRPKEIWEERVCPFCVSGSVETEKHFILECEALKVSREKFANFLTASTWYNLFSEEHIVKMGALIISLNKQRSDLKKLIQLDQIVP
ncbi:uncharacterized protein LOC131069300 isoform X2 [Cryptomeria japonica]|nr:uncharacterized protein LOC131069300 isoform X2 [Cryptomeria japonica]